MSSSFSVIFGAFGCLCALIVLLICASHSLLYYLQNHSVIQNSQKRTMLMESIMIVLFLLPTLSNIFLRNNYFRPYHSEQHFSQIGCKLSMILTVPPYSGGKIVLYSLFMYRISKTFEHSMFAISKTIPFVLIPLLSLTVITFSVCITISVLKQENTASVQNIGNVLGCALHYNAQSPAMTLLSRGLPLVNMLIEAVVCVYLIYIFVSRLNKLAAVLYTMEVSSNISSIVKVNTISEINPADIAHTDSADSKHQKGEENVQKVVCSMAKTEAMQLKSITVKQAVLGVSALASSFGFYIYGMMTASPDFIGWDICINVLSIHLMFNYSQFVWNALCVCCKINIK